MKIALGAAKGLAFLHEGENPVIYRDFKASNILLDSVSIYSMSYLSSYPQLVFSLELNYTVALFLIDFCKFYAGLYGKALRFWAGKRWSRR